MTLSLRSLLVVSLGLGLAACAPEPAPTPTEPLQIVQHDRAVVRGTFDAGELVLTFRARTPAAYQASVEVTIGAHTLTLAADADAGTVAFDAAGARLSPDEVGALEAFALAIADELGEVEDVAVMHESLLVAASRYFARAPIEVALASSHHVVTSVKGTSFSTGNDGKTCVRRGEVRTATYDGSAGTTSESWTVGADGGQQWNGDFACMGRCGVACGSYDWTLDCLEHDACSRRYYSSSGALDHNCGDEYSEAADDYTAFWKRCYS